MSAIDLREIDNAAALLRQGGLVAMPTETVYGLAADATNDEAVARIFDAKGRPQFNPLIVHVTSQEMAARYVAISPIAKVLMNAFWPGALTIVLPRSADCDVSLLCSAGLDTLGVRCPNHAIAQSLISRLDGPLAAPSANRSGAVSPTTAAHVRASLGDRVDFILDGGPCSVGVESTIVKIVDGAVTLLRPGGVAKEEIESVTGLPAKTLTAGSAIEAPGMMQSHYAPDVRVRLNRMSPEPNEAFLGFGEIAASGDAARNLSRSGDLREAAANLFSHLHQLDRICRDENLTAIAVAPIPNSGLGTAINDRLTRAAAARK